LRPTFQARKAGLFLLVWLSSLLAISACQKQALVSSPTATPTILATAAETEQPMAAVAARMTPTVVLANTMTPTVRAENEIVEASPTPLASTAEASWFMQSPVTVDEGVRYGRVIVSPAILYSDPEQAARRQNPSRTFPNEEVYITFSSEVTYDGELYYEVMENGWVAASDIEEVFPSDYQGIQIHTFPTGGFGWMVDNGFSYQSPPSEGKQRMRGAYLTRYSLHEVYDIAIQEDGEHWYKIGDQQWVADVDFSYVALREANPTMNQRPRWIEVNLSQQNLVVYEDEKPIFATLVSTGRQPAWTGEGAYTIYNKIDMHPLISPDPVAIGDYYLEDVPYLLYYQGSWAIHSAYWHDKFGKPNSHGCVNLSMQDADWLFAWANEGDWIILYRE
jgi:lipoprotein-anchoring transpeptidase ErfK/SrfK